MERELAKCCGFEFMLDQDHRCPMLAGHFEYGEDGCGNQGIGLIVNTEFMMKFLDVFDAETFSKINGKYCWVTHNNDSITKIEPLRKKEGTTFDIEEWRKETRKGKQE